MGVVDKFLNYMKLNNNEDDDYDDEYFDDGEEEDEEPAPKKGFGAKPSAKEEEEDEEEAPAPPKKVALSRPGSTNSNKVMPMRTGANVRKASIGGGMEVCVFKPVSFDEVTEIADTLLKNRTIILNLEGLDMDVAQRIMDFTSGSCYASEGNLQRISKYIIILTPKSVDISGDIPDIPDILGDFDLTLHPMT